MNTPISPAPRRTRNLIGLAGLALLMALLPLMLRTPYLLSTLVLIGIYSIVTVGLCLLMGYAGQVSLGQAAFFGMGAYGSGILTVRLGWSPWAALGASAVGTGLLAYLVGVPIFRLRGPYLAMGTLALGSIFHIAMNEWRPVSGGHTGLPGIPRLAVGGLVLNTDVSYYYLVWGVALVGLAIALNLVDSRFGRALEAIRASEPAAESLGVQVDRYKLLTLAISAVYASVAGSLYAHYMIFVSPGAFSLDTSVRLVLMAAVGGLASIWGAPLGAAVVMLLTLGLREVVPLLAGGGSGEHQVIAYGVLLVAIMIFMPEGVTQRVSAAAGRALQRWRDAGGRRLRPRAGRG